MRRVKCPMGRTRGLCPGAFPWHILGMSSKPRIILTRKWPDPVEQALQARFDVVLNPDDRAFTADDLKQALRECDALCPTVTDALTADVLSIPDRRAAIIANYGVGYNHIDVDAARAAGLRVTNTPDVLTDATADIALILMLNVARRTGEGERMLRAGKWGSWRPDSLLGTDITGKTVGLVGFGRIAQAVARRAHHGFGMQVLVYGRSAADPAVLATCGARQTATLEDLLEQSDFVSLHCPSTPQTRHLIDADALSRMKPGAFLINTARGDVVDEQALITALDAGEIAGAGLDVFEREPHVPDALIRRENVVLLPHMGSATRETRVAMGMKAVDNLIAWFDGAELPDPVV